MNNVVRASTFQFMNKYILFVVFTEMQIYGPMHESRSCLGPNIKYFLETLFICNDIDKKF